MLDILNAGSILNNRYEVRDLLSCSEQEALYLIEDLNPPHEQLVLKEFFFESSKKFAPSEEFLNRIAALSEVRHPNLVKIYDFFVEIPEKKSDERFYIVMEYVKGRTMEEIFQKDLREEPLPTKMLLKQMVKVCGALKHLNNQNPSPIVFCVLSPKNIILTPERQIKLFNYGLYNLLRYGDYGKTAGFIAPEYINKKIINEKNDVFSLGATIHYLLSGKNPEMNPLQFASIMDYNKDVSQELNDFILKCLLENPDERPGLQEVSNFLLSSYIGKRPSSKISLARPAPPEDRKSQEEDKVIEFVSLDYSVKIEEPVIPENIKTDVFKLSEEKITPPVPSQELKESSRGMPGETGSIKLDFRAQFQKSAKRGTRRIGTDAYLSAKEALIKKKGISDLDEVSKKAKDSIKKSTGLLEKLAQSKRLEKLKISPEKTLQEEIVPEPQEQEKIVPELQEQEENISEVKEILQEESLEKEPSDESPATAKPMSLAEKLAQKYAKKKQEKKDEPGEEHAEKSTSKFDAGHIGLSAEWREQKLIQCEPKPDASPIIELLKEGSVIKDRYEIAEVINKDCYGAVYMAFDREAEEGLDPVVGIKEIQYKPPEDNQKLTEKIIANFVRFASNLQKLDHPNLVNITDYFFSYSGDRSSIRLFLVMEFIEGYTLEDIIKTHQQKNSRIPATTIFAMITKVCEALDYLHNQSPPRTHGDITPENIIISYNGEIKLIKYGFREIFMVDNILVHPVHGILGYFAPEQTGSDFKNTKADIFALGAIMYYLMGGQNPEEKPYEFLPLKKLNPYISPNIEELITQSIRLNPEKRIDIKLLKENLSKITLVELDSNLLQQQKDMQDKRKASMKELANVSPIGTEFALRALKYFIAVMAILGLALGIYKLIDYLTNKPEPGKKLYISISTDKKIQEIDVKTDRITKTIPLEFSSGPVAGSGITKKIFLSDKSKIYVMNTMEKKLTGMFDSMLDISQIIPSPDGTKLYILSKKENKIKGIDINSKGFTGECELPPSPTSAFISYDGSKIYIINYSENNYLTALDTSNFEIIQQIPISESASDVALTRNGDMAFIVHKDIDLLSAVNLSDKSIRTISLKNGTEKAQPVSLAIYNDKIYVINQLYKNITVVKASDLSIAGTIAIDSHPTIIKSASDKLYIYTIGVSGVKRNYEIKVVDINTESIIQTIKLENMINDMAVSED